MSSENALESASPVSNWDLIVVKARLDALTFDQMTSAVRSLRGEGRKRLALDLRGTRFISLAAIQFIVAVAKELETEGGEVVLVGASDKTLRHFEIYGSLEHARVEKSLQALGEVEFRRHELHVHEAGLDAEI